MWTRGGTVGQWLAQLQEGSEFEPTGRLGPFCVEFACFLPQSKDMQVRLTGDSKMPVGVDVSLSGCLSLYVDWPC